jgi:ADP-ribose pyrophosphatase YjhB (NUDIX family)
MSFPFNVRVYGALIFMNHILLSHEVYQGKSFTKLPGGGLEFGEGLRDALQREFMEETGLEVAAKDHLYTTDFFQASAFNPDHQVISVYYRVVCAEGLEMPWGKEGKSGAQEFAGKETPKQGVPAEVTPLEENQSFSWVPVASLTEEDFTFPIDKKMVPLLKA